MELYYLGLHCRGLKNFNRLNYLRSNIGLDQINLAHYRVTLHEYPTEERVRVIRDVNIVSRYALSEYVLEIDHKILDRQLSKQSILYLEDCILGYHPITYKHFVRVCQLDSTTERICKECGKRLPLGSFYIHRCKGRSDSVSNFCKRCWSAINRLKYVQKKVS